MENRIFENGILSGNVQNCYIRLNTVPEIPPSYTSGKWKDERYPAGAIVLEIFFPKSADEDRWGTRDILNEPYIARKEWIDSGLRLFLKGIPQENALLETEPLILKIASYFSGKYPHDVFKQYKNYSCGKQRRVILLHINETIVLKYCEELRADFTKNFFKVIFNESKNCRKIYINTYELGTLEYKNEHIEMHRWENEDEAQSSSYLSRRYTQRLLDGVIKEPDTKANMSEIIKSSMSLAAIETEDRRLFDTALEILDSSTLERKQ